MSKDSSKTDQNLTKPRKDLGHPIWVVVNAVAIFAVSQLLAALIMGLILGLTHPHADIADLLNNSVAAQFGFLLLAESMAAGLVLWVLKRFRLSFATIGLRRPMWSDLPRGLAGFGIFYLLLIAVSIITTLIFPSINNTPQDVGFNNVVGAGGQVLALISLVILPPIGEEILVRGFLFSGLRARMNFVKAGLVTSILFSVAHLQLGDGSALVWGAALDTFVLSAVLVYLRETTGALYAGMLVHALNNLVAFIIKFH